MPTVGFTISQANLDRYVTAVCNNHGYQYTVKDDDGNDIPNPQTPEQFTKAWNKKLARDEMKYYEYKQARTNEDQTINQEVDAISLTD